MAHWTLYVLLGFAAGSIFGAIALGGYLSEEMVKDTCGTCLSNLETMVGNFNTMAYQCKMQNPYKDAINKTVMGYAT